MGPILGGEMVQPDGPNIGNKWIQHFPQRVGREREGIVHIFERALLLQTPEIRKLANCSNYTTLPPPPSPRLPAASVPKCCFGASILVVEQAKQETPLHLHPSHQMRVLKTRY